MEIALVYLVISSVGVGVMSLLRKEYQQINDQTFTPIKSILIIDYNDRLL